MKRTQTSFIGQKIIEEILGASSLQSVVAAYIAKAIFQNINEDLYFVLINEEGVNIDHKNDLAIYDKIVL